MAEVKKGKRKKPKKEVMFLSQVDIQSNSLSLANKPQDRIPIYWLWIVIPLFQILASCIWIGCFNNDWNKAAILVMFSLYVGIAFIIHYNFKNWSLTGLLGLGGLILILLALNVYTPQEVAKKLEETTVKKYPK